MFEAYAISVKLVCLNLVSPQLALLSKEFSKLEILTVSLNKELKGLGADSSGMRALATATNATNRAFEKANISAAALRNHLAAIHQTGRAMNMASGGIVPMPGGRPPGGGGGGSMRGPTGMHGGNILVGPKGIGIGAMGFGAGDLFWPIAGAAAAAYAGSSLFESAKELDIEKNRFRLFGMTEAQNQQAFDYTKKLNIYGTTQIERMRTFREAQGVFRESGLSGDEALRGAKLAAPVLAKLDFLASSLDDESRAKMKTANINMLRYVESSGGLKSPEEFNRIAEFGYKLNVSSGGTVDWAQLRQFKARAGAAGFHLTDDALARLEPVIGEMKGGAVGFGLSTAFNRLVGATRAPNQVVGELLSQGIWDRSRVELNKLGGIKRFTSAKGPLSEKYAELLLTNPELFYETAIRPIYEKMHLSATDIARQNVMLFGTTGGRNMTLIENQMANIHSSISALRKTQGIEAAMTIGKGTLSGQQIEFEAAWKDFKVEWGTTALPMFTEILKSGADILRYIDAHTDTIRSAFSATSWISSAVNPFSKAHAAIGGPSGIMSSSFDLGDTIGRKAAAMLQVHTSVNLDGKKVGNIVSGHIARSLPTGSQTGPGSYDPSLGQIPSGSP